MQTKNEIIKGLINKVVPQADGAPAGLLILGYLEQEDMLIALPVNLNTGEIIDPQLAPMEIRYTKAAVRFMLEAPHARPQPG